MDSKRSSSDLVAPSTNFLQPYQSRIHYVFHTYKITHYISYQLHVTTFLSLHVMGTNPVLGKVTPSTSPGMCKDAAEAVLDLVFITFCILRTWGGLGRLRKAWEGLGTWWQWPILRIRWTLQPAVRKISPRHVAGFARRWSWIRIATPPHTP